MKVKVLLDKFLLNWIYCTNVGVVEFVEVVAFR